MTNNKPSVFIIVLNYKNFSDTNRCLDSILNITYPTYTIVVVDNDSQNDSLKEIDSYLNQKKVTSVLLQADHNIPHPSDNSVVLIQSKENKGYAAGNNIGIRYALSNKADYILILNNDTVVPPDFLNPLVEFSENTPNAGVVGPKVLRENGDIDTSCARRRPTLGGYFFRIGMGRFLFPNNKWVREHYYRGEYDFKEPKEVDLVSGCCMIIKKQVFEEIGLLDEGTFLMLEEFILHEKLRTTFYKTYIIPNSHILHLHGKSRSKVSTSFVKNHTKDSMRYYLTKYRNLSNTQYFLVSTLAKHF